MAVRIIKSIMYRPGPPGPPGNLPGTYYTASQTDTLLADKADLTALDALLPKADVLNEPDMATGATDKPPSQASVVAYVEDELEAIEFDPMTEAENAFSAVGGTLFSNGKITFAVWDRQGRPIPGAADLIGEALGAQGYVPIQVENDLAAAGGTVFSNGKITFSVWDRDGRPIPDAAQLIAEGLDRIGYQPGGSGAFGVGSINGQTGAVTIAAGPNVAITSGSGTITVSSTGGGGGGTPILQALDIWEGLSRNSGDPLYEGPIGTYSQLIAFIDGKLAGESVTKEVIGTHSDGSTDIHAYTYGPAGVPHMLLLSGTHGNEALGIWAALRYFVGYVTSDDPVMAALRQRVRITWIPALNSGRYLAARTNSNNVNINRNYPNNWAFVDEEKGDAPLDQPESIALKDVLDSHPIGLVVDAHTQQTAGSYLNYLGPSSGAPVGRRLFFGIVSLWNDLFNTDDIDNDMYQGGLASQAGPTLLSWSPRYLRYTLGRMNASSVLIEGANELAGSTTNETSTREAMRLYCGFIHMSIALWLEQGQVPEPVMPRPYIYQRTTSTEDALSISSGGSLIDTTTAHPVRFNQYERAGSTRRDFMDVVLRSPGYFTIEATAVLEADAAAAGHTRVEMSFGWAATPVGGGNVAILSDAAHRATVDVPPAGGRSVLHNTWKIPASQFDITATNTLYRAQVYLRLTDGGADPVILRSCRAVVTHHPLDEIEQEPAPLLPS